MSLCRRQRPARGQAIRALIDAGVDLYRAGTAERDVKTLRDAVVDVNFDNDLKRSCTPLWLKSTGCTWMACAVSSDDQRKAGKAVTGSKDSAVVVAASTTTIARWPAVSCSSWSMSTSTPTAPHSWL